MKFHKEGIPSLLLVLLFSALLIGLAYGFGPEGVVGTILHVLAIAASCFLTIVILQFFRDPKRNWVKSANGIIAPADGRVVVIEEVEEPEYFKDKRLQVSIFMSPLNVHINRFPISGIVKYVKYHAGLYLVAYHPKSSTENERSTVVVQHENGKSILFRQIAGALARRIVYYCKENDKAIQGEQFGFIKFGSRVDLFLPLGTKINVKLEEHVKGGITVIGEI
ncbi:MAG TPA: phosphatidylserine decarboxylase family protein [Bacteroidia bacterium]|jgi:phosphatidylserine decarboxylase|nr:phosphatidylserine decarboxylase family protein [Bacteroidia bacterium]